MMPEFWLRYWLIQEIESLTLKADRGVFISMVQRA